MRTEYVMPDEMEHVLAALMPENRLICRVALHTGLRISDVLAMKTEQLGQQFWISEKKTKKRKRVNLPRALVEELREQAGTEFVFQNARSPHRHRVRQTVWADIKRASKAFRLPQNVGPHSLRKVYAVELLAKSGGDVARVQRALNHADVGVTMLYCMAATVHAARYGTAQERVGRAPRKRKKRRL